MSRDTFSTQQIYILDSYIEHMRNMRSLVTNALNIYGEQERMFRTMLTQTLSREQRTTLPTPPTPPRPATAQETSGSRNPSTTSNTAQEIINILNRRSTPHTRTTTTRREWTIPQRSNLNTDPTQHLNPGRHMRDFFQFFTNEELQDVVVTPSERDVRIATTTRRYHTLHDPVNDTCPITQLQFEDNDMVTRIDHCGHIFSANDLTRWFRHSVRCPVCRFDIREANISSQHYNRAVNEIIQRHNRENDNSNDNTNDNGNDADNESSSNEASERRNRNTTNDNVIDERHINVEDNSDVEIDDNTLRNMTSLILRDINNGTANGTPGFDASGNAILTYNLLSVVDISNNRHMMFQT